MLEEGTGKLDDSGLERAGMEATTGWTRRPTEDPRRAAKLYMERHNVANVMNKLISGLARDKPDEPLVYMYDKIAELRDGGVIDCGSIPLAKQTNTARPNDCTPVHRDPLRADPF